MGCYWKVAGRYASLLQRVLDEYKESEKAPGMGTPNTVKILADMRRYVFLDNLIDRSLTEFRTAFDLDSLISRAPKIHNTGNPKMAVTPVRTPAPGDLEYLDVFDFFNVPRLPVNPGATVDTNGGGQESATIHAQQTPNATMDHSMNGFNEFNITNFMFDANTDWLGS
jgi:hypothetical protein